MNGMFDRTSVLPVILALGASMLLSFGLTPLVKRLAYRIGAVDVPKDRRRMHDHPIPRCSSSPSRTGSCGASCWGPA